VTASPRWRRLEPDARREQILECAVRLFGERPYAAVSTTEIALQAGVARGLLNHYFGTKRELYLEVVRRMVLLPDLFAGVSDGTVEERVERSVDWFLDAVGAHGKTFVAVIGAEGVGTDRDVEAILAEADDLAAAGVLETLGVDDVASNRATIRAYGGLVKAAIREWVRDGTLTRDEVHLLLSRALITIVRDVLPTN
jgi:AcrR family transcriptional regulator